MRIALIICAAIFAAALVALIKTENALKNQNAIIDALYAHNIAAVRRGDHDAWIPWSHLESYSATMLRFWDWGYTRLLPPEDFEKVKPYIGLPADPDDEEVAAE